MMPRSWVAGALLAITSAGCHDEPPPRPPQAMTAAPAAAPIDFGDYLWVERSHSSARVNTTCAQSILYQTRTAGYRWGEVLVIEAHTDHWVAGQTKITLGSQQSSSLFSSERRPVSHASDVGDDRRCRSNAAPPTASLPAPTGTTLLPGPGAPPASTSAPRAPSIAITLDGRVTFDARPAVPLFRHDIQHGASGEAPLDMSPVSAGVNLQVELWGMSPIDWIGVTFEIRTYEIVPRDEATYRAHIEEKRHAFKHPEERRPHLEECRSRLASPACADVRGALCLSDSDTLAQPECADIKRDHDLLAAPHDAPSTGTPPPPPLAESPSPRPSQNATWIPGHWIFADGAWSFWSTGFWRVDEEDRTQGRTATAPAPPPAPKGEPETRQPPPTPTAVWTPGYWHWSSSWRWVPGAWRVPPTRTTVWRPARWHADIRVRGTFRLDPGGWLTR